MSWRPKEGWKNPYTDPHWNDDGEISGREADIFEEGADAILRAQEARRYTDPWMTTFSGRQFFITRATADDIYIEDIAHALSNLCRYTGHCKTFYSVAEHSVRMAEIMIKSNMAEIAPLALLHDSAEAYLNDMTPGLKGLLLGYKDIENNLLTLILDKYKVKRSSFYISLVKLHDVRIRTPEVLSLFSSHEGWELDERGRDYGCIHPWSPKKAERKFLKMFRRLYNGNH